MYDIQMIVRMIIQMSHYLSEMRGKKCLIGGKRVEREEEKIRGTGLIYQVKTKQIAEYVHLKAVGVHRFT